jgi:uncharacterized protein (TIRG00374 family)
MKKRIVDLLKLVVTAGILCLIFKKFAINWSDIHASFAQSNPWWFLASAGTQLLAILFSILRWNVLLTAQGMCLPPSRLFSSYMVGRFLGTFTPTGLGLEAYKAYDAGRYTRKWTESVAVILVEKIAATFLALSLMVLITLPLVQLPWEFVVVFFAFFLFILALAGLLVMKPRWLEKILLLPLPLKAKIQKPLRNAVEAFDTYGRQRMSLLWAILLGLAVYVSLFATFYTNGLALRTATPRPGQLYALDGTQSVRQNLSALRVEFAETGAATGELEVFLTAQEAAALAGSGVEVRARPSMYARKGFSLVDVLKVGPLTQIATMIPLSIAGIGLREGAFVGLLQSIRIWVGTRAVLASLMWYFVSISINVIGAVIFLVRRTDYEQAWKEQQEMRGKK